MQKPVEIPDGLFPSFYYLRDIMNNPIVTVCLLRKTPSTRPCARGISICSEDDEFDMVEGMRIATSNAVRAYKGRIPIPVLRCKAKKLLQKASCNFKQHGYVNPKLTVIEKSVQIFI